VRELAPPAQPTDRLGAHAQALRHLGGGEERNGAQAEGLEATPGLEELEHVLRSCPADVDAYLPHRLDYHLAACGVCMHRKSTVRLTMSHLLDA